MIRVLPLHHRDRSAAQDIHAVVKAAHRQEAALLQVAEMASAPRTPEEIEASEGFWLGALLEEETVGVLCIGPDDGPHDLCIAMLAVHPRAQRRGIATLLLSEALARGAGISFVVAVAAANAPALALYARFGFAPYRQGVMGSSNTPIVKLRRPA